MIQRNKNIAEANANGALRPKNNKDTLSSKRQDNAHGLPSTAKSLFSFSNTTTVQMIKNVDVLCVCVAERVSRSTDFLELILLPLSSATSLSIPLSLKCSRPLHRRPCASSRSVLIGIVGYYYHLCPCNSLEYCSLLLLSLILRDCLSQSTTPTLSLTRRESY